MDIFRPSVRTILKLILRFNFDPRSKALLRAVKSKGFPLEMHRYYAMFLLSIYDVQTLITNKDNLSSRLHRDVPHSCCPS
jgi:hypothetical protein